MDDEDQAFINPSPVVITNSNENVIDFLRREADLAEDRAKRLREFANALESGTSVLEAPPLGMFSF